MVRINHGFSTISEVPELGEKFRPSNGTVGEAFMDDWCGTCAGHRNCTIHQKAMLYRTDEPEYPVEWIYDADGEACCMAYVPVGTPDGDSMNSGENARHDG